MTNTRGASKLIPRTLIRNVQAVLPQSIRRPQKSHLAGLLIAIFLTLRLRQRIHKKVTMPAASTKAPAFPGFKPLSEQVFVREPAGDAAIKPAPDHPDVVLVYGWGDGIPKHVVKYADGFQTVYPAAKQIVVLSPISKAMFSTLAERSLQMAPVVQELFPDGAHVDDSRRRILVHTMSNTGAVNYAATINRFKDVYSRPFPHTLFIMDSTPGSVAITWDNLKRWSRAMSLGMAKFFPWPFVVTQGIFLVFLFINNLVEQATGRESAGGWSRRASLNKEWEAIGARKLYMYSKEDDLINYEDIEVHAAEAKQLGWKVDVEVFEGSGHVGHMRLHAAQYWTAIAESWKKAVADGEA
ncbi:DUF829-domain-containing protein [Emericellopsis cladophorae]|uniref:DUF829-domain-containing protein n=1 Tax=Emericellopsis cladophorae TaxID=2686198 RepID=A0A9P9XZN6_9HYPO|nr:DUF829-domain-containing protein [Emericellopsis cladophorae]KAI6780625.1 DUF829-domain-containing protein [Emericellopsis cladophorae]